MPAHEASGRPTDGGHREDEPAVALRVVPGGARARRGDRTVRPDRPGPLRRLVRLPIVLPVAVGRWAADRIRRARINGPSPARIALGLVAVAAVVVLVLAIFGASARQWFAQRDERDAARQRLEDVRDQREDTRRQIENAEDDEEIRRSARELFEMVDPDEDLVIILPRAQDDIGLPDIWPFTGVERELGAG